LNSNKEPRKSSEKTERRERGWGREREKKRKGKRERMN
jgi:hypothetical protein